MTGARWLGFCKFAWWKQRVEEVLMEEIIQEALNKGVEMHVSGEFDLADKLYDSVISYNPIMLMPIIIWACLSWIRDMIWMLCHIYRRPFRLTPVLRS